MEKIRICYQLNDKYDIPWAFFLESLCMSMFVWRFAHNAMATEANLFYRNTAPQLFNYFIF